MAAAELFMNRSTEQIKKICSETLEGHQRAIMGTMTVEDIYKNRAAFSEQVLQVCSQTSVFTLIRSTQFRHELTKLAFLSTFVHTHTTD